MPSPGTLCAGNCVAVFLNKDARNKVNESTIIETELVEGGIGPRIMPDPKLPKIREQTNLTQFLSEILPQSEFWIRLEKKKLRTMIFIQIYPR